MTQEQLNLGLHINWEKHDPLGDPAQMKVTFWWQVPTIELREVEAPGEDGTLITNTHPVAVAWAEERLEETYWEGTNDYGPLWALIKEKEQLLKQDN